MKHFNHNECMDIDKPLNAFLLLNGVPYLLGDYLERYTFRQLDRSFIQSGITVDQREGMRALVDINIDDIGHRADGYPAIVGNNSNQQNLLEAVAREANNLDHRLDVIHKGIIVRVNYQVENQRSHQIIRSASEELRISSRNYFIDINPRDINDNAIIVNFTDSMVSRISEFTHGIDRMIFRITSIQLFYEGVYRENPPLKNPRTPPELYQRDPYFRHQLYQNQHMIDAFFKTEDFYPTNWASFNRFYHFEDLGEKIILHRDELRDRNNMTFRAPCGNIIVNRTFMINPGHRIVFKVSIWKNDLISVNNTQGIAQALGVQDLGYPGHHHHHCEKPSIDLDYSKIIELLEEGRKEDHYQHMQIHKLSKKMSFLENQVIELSKIPDPDPIPEPEPEPLPTPEPEEENIPEDPIDPPEEGNPPPVNED